jgi:hypothetical protein
MRRNSYTLLCNCNCWREYTNDKMCQGKYKDPSIISERVVTFCSKTNLLATITNNVAPFCTFVVWRLTFGFPLSRRSLDQMIVMILCYALSNGTWNHRRMKLSEHCYAAWSDRMDILANISSKPLLDSCHKILVLWVHGVLLSPISLFWKNKTELMRRTCRLCIFFSHAAHILSNQSRRWVPPTASA